MAAETMYKEIRRAGNTLIMDKNELEIKGKELYCFCNLIKKLLYSYL